MASPLNLRVDVDMSQLISAARESGTSVEDLAAAFDTVESASAGAATAATTTLGKINTEGATAASGVDQIGGAAESVGGALGGLGSAASQALSGDVSGGVSSALGALGGMAAAVGIGGPVGSAVLGALGELVGGLIAQLDLFGERARAASDEVSNALVAAGGAFDAADLKARVQDVVTDTDKWAAANTLAKVTGMDLASVVAGLAGDTDSAAALAENYASSIATVGGAWESVAGKDLLAAEQALAGVTDGLDAAPGKSAAYAGAMDKISASSEAATEKVQDTAKALAAPLTSPEVVYSIDDSAVRNWRPPLLQIPAQVVVRPGQVQYTG
jgi:hypothetical protein